MKLQLISDLHSEFWDNPERLYQRIAIAPDLDFLVIAGDLVVPGRQPEVFIEAAFQHYAKKARHVLYVDGNHEWYGGLSTEETEKAIRAGMPENVHWLWNDELTLDGVHFYGGAMWFPDPDGLNQFYRRYINDFKLIKDFESWVYDRNRKFGLLGDALIRPETVVVTHHLPHHASVPIVFKGEPTNRFFVSDQTDLIQRKQPRLWLHGHTHHPCDYSLGKTRVVCNPHGYPGERKEEPYPVVVLDL